MDQLCNRKKSCILPQCREDCEKRTRLIRRICAQSVIETAISLRTSDYSKIISGKAKHRAGERCNQRNVLQRVMNDLQDCPQCFNFRCLQKIYVCSHCAGNAQGLQRIPKFTAHTAGRTQEDYNIIGNHRA